jgi:CHAT domain-containing protein/tetratricopeptide (TPR) repeat protein
VLLGRRQRRRLVAIACLLFLFFLAGCSRPHPQSLDSAQDLLRREEYAAALRAVDQATSKDSQLQARAQILKAEILLELRQSKQALAVLDATSVPQQWPELHGRYLLQRAHAYYRLNNDAKAESLLNEAAAIAKSANLPVLQAEIDFRRSSLLVRKGESAEAEKTLLAVIDAARKNGAGYLEAAATGNYGFTLLNAGRYDQALTWFQRARELFSATGGKSSLGRVEGNVGWCYFRLGNLDEAMARFENAEKIFASTSNRQAQQLWLGNQASVLLTRGDFSGAAARYRKAVQIARDISDERSVSTWLTNLAEATLDAGDPNAAESFNNEALSIATRIQNSPLLIYVSTNAARIALKRGQLKDAEKLFTAALQSQDSEPTALLDAHAGLASVYAESGLRSKAIAQYRRTLTLIEQQRADLSDLGHKLSWFSSLIRFYDAYVRFLMRNGMEEKAFSVAESSRGRLLAERAGVAPVAGSSSLTKAGACAIARRAKSVILAYWLGKEESYMWVVSGSRLASHRLPPASEIRASVDEYNGLVMSGRDPLTSELPAGDKLLRILVSPALAEIRPGDRVVVVPDGSLHKLNFEALPVRSPAPHYWIEDVRLRVTPSLALFASGNGHRLATTSILMIGDPEEADKKAQLRFVQSEMQDIASALPSAEKVVYRGAQARPGQYLQSQPARFSLIHFAAHAVANESSPLDSAVLLSGADEKRKLFARDVMGIPLKADVVTISACRGAGAKVYGGEGPVGLAWAFLHAGARRVVASLWDVDDRSTASLMRSFYSGMARGEEPADALRDAKLALIRSGSSSSRPFYWAAFQTYAGAI